MGKISEAIISEVFKVLEAYDGEYEDQVLNLIAESEKIVCAGVGRVGLNAAGFAKRLRHMGKDAFFIQDQTLPRVGKRDLLLIVSGSGETKTLKLYAQIAREQEVPIVLVTTSKHSPIAQMSDVVLQFDCPSEKSESLGFVSTQPMTSLFEQASHLVLDHLVLRLMTTLDIGFEQMRGTHNELE